MFGTTKEASLAIDGIVENTSVRSVNTLLNKFFITLIPQLILLFSFIVLLNLFLLNIITIFVLKSLKKSIDECVPESSEPSACTWRAMMKAKVCDENGESDELLMFEKPYQCQGMRKVRAVQIANLLGKPKCP